MRNSGSRVALDHRHRVGDDVEVAQPEKVHLEQTEVLDAVHLVLRHDRRVGGLLARFGLALDGDVVGDRILGDHHGRGMDPVGALEPFEAPGDVDDPLQIGIGVVHRPQVGRRLVAIGVLRVLLEAVLERRVTAHHHRRHRLGQLVADAVRVAEDAGRVAHGVAGLDRAERDDLGDVIAPVALGGVADHLVAVSRVEVHVDVGHRHAARVEEAFEQQVVTHRVEVGDPQRIGDRTAGRRPATRADADAAVLGVLDQVPRDQEVRREPHVADDLELVAEPLGHVRRQFVAPALCGTPPGEVGEVRGVVGETGRQREVRQQRFAELDLEFGPFGDPQRVVARRRDLPEQVTHLGGRLQVVLGALELEALGVRQQSPRLHAQQRVVGLVVVLVRVVAVVRREERGADLLGDLDQFRVRVALGLQTVVLEFDEQIVAPEDVLQPGRLGQRTLLVAVHERLQHVATEAAGGGDEAVGVLLEQLPVHPGLVVVALHEGEARELDEVLVTGLVLGQQRQVVVELLAALGVAPRVVDPAAAGRSLTAVVVGHVGLGADDRLDPLLVALAVEVERAVHVAVIGDADRRLAVADGFGDELVEPSRAVEHRELGVDVEVGEGIGHGLLTVGWVAGWVVGGR